MTQVLGALCPRTGFKQLQRLSEGAKAKVLNFDGICKAAMDLWPVFHLITCQTSALMLIPAILFVGSLLLPRWQRRTWQLSMSTSWRHPPQMHSEPQNPLRTQLSPPRSMSSQTRSHPHQLFRSQCLAAEVVRSPTGSPLHVLIPG